MTKTDSVSGVTTYTYNNLNQLSTTTNGVATIYTYDSNGNLISEVTGSNSTVYRWANDGENRLMGVTVNEGGVTRNVGYQYNAQGIRVGKVVDGVETRYLIDELQPYSQVVEEYDALGNPKGSYVYGLDLLGRVSGMQPEFYHSDGLGSTRVLTNSLGVVGGTYTYDAYGNLIVASGGSGNAYLFAGEQRDSETGLDYLRARYYDPLVGRFVSADAYEGTLDDPMSLHDYQYAHANPVVNTDPSGYMTNVANLMAGVAIVGILAGLGYTTYGAAGILGSGGSWQDAISIYDQYLAGFADIVTFGGSTEFRKWQYGKSATANHRGAFFSLGRLAGSGASFALGFAAPSNFGKIGWAGKIAQGHTVLGAGLGSYQSTQNIASGNFTPFDFVAFLPLAGYLSQRIVMPILKSGKAITWDSNLPAGDGATNAFGQMRLSSQGTQLDQDMVRIHEGVHSFLSPSRYSLGAKLSAKWSNYFYENSFFFKYIEEALAETVAQVATRKMSGISLGEAIKRGMTFPINHPVYAVGNKPMNLKNVGLEIIGFSTLLIPGFYGSYILGTKIDEWNDE